MVLESFRGFFGKLPVGCRVPFREEWLPSGHSTIKAWLVECCTDGCPSVRFSHLHKGTLDLIHSDRWILGLPVWPRPFFPDSSVWLGGQIQEVCWWFHISCIWEWWRLPCSLALYAVEMFYNILPQICLDTILSCRSTDNSLNLMARLQKDCVDWWEKIYWIHF